jgi:hypothetical protein
VSTPGPHHSNNTGGNDNLGIVREQTRELVVPRGFQLVVALLEEGQPRLIHGRPDGLSYRAEHHRRDRASHAGRLEVARERRLDARMPNFHCDVKAVRQRSSVYLPDARHRDGYPSKPRKQGVCSLPEGLADRSLHLDKGARRCCRLEH